MSTGYFQEKNLPRGENHPKAKLTDHEVELIRQLHESGAMGYKKLARKFEAGKSTIKSICDYRTR